MGRFLYGLGLKLYWIVLMVTSVFNEKARMFIEGRKQWRRELNSPLENGKETKRIWIHSASVGEFEQARPIIERIKALNPDIFIIATFFSPSGYELRKNYAQVDAVSYLPWDTSTNAEEFIEMTKPHLAIFVKYEFWFHFLHTLTNRRIPIVIISAIFRKDQIFFRWYGGFFRKMLLFFDLISVQNEESRKLLLEIGVDRVEVTGDTRFDRVVETVNTVLSAAPGKNYMPTFQKEVLIAGSVWPQDMKILIPVMNEPNVRLNFIIAPHEIDVRQIRSWQKQLNGKSILYSEIRDSTSVETFESVTDQGYEVVFIDNIGMLSNLYSLGKYAFVGGAFKQGLHNILEAAAFGMPVFFGNKKYQKFQEAIDLIGIESAFAISGSEELKSLLETLQNNVAAYEAKSKAASDYVQSRSGATTLIMNYLTQKLGHNERSS